MINCLLLAGLIIAIVYALLQFYFIIGWLKIKPPAQIENNYETTIAIVVPFRNEASTIAKCINSLINQKYPATNFQIILVDDHSDDDSFLIAKQISNNYENISVFKLPDGKAGKKHAIAFGVEQSESVLIVLTDADCTHSQNYILTVANFYSLHRPQLIAADVRFNDGDKFIQKFQSLELTGLMLITASAFELNNPFLCNGANLIFEKSFFNSINGYANNESVAGGDDVFLLHKAKRVNAKTMFLSHLDATVSTASQPTLHTFFDQRIRWAHKSKFYTDIFSSFVSLLVFLNCFFLLLSPFLLIFYGSLISLTLYSSALIFKFSIDFLLLFLATQKHQKTKLLWLFPLAELFQIVYVFAIGFLVLFENKINWKGRTLISGKKI